MINAKQQFFIMYPDNEIYEYDSRYIWQKDVLMAPGEDSLFPEMLKVKEDRLVFVLKAT